jgi:hypothetical protein
MIHLEGAFKVFRYCIDMLQSIWSKYSAICYYLYEVTGMCKESQALIDIIRNMRRQCENKAMSKLLGTLVLTLGRNH